MKPSTIHWADPANLMLSIGHRGAKGHEPENTVLSIEKALALGADGIEIDVYFVDGHLMVIHDDRLERTTNGSGYVFEKSFDYLRMLDAGKREKIPTLEEVFEVVSRHGFVNVELKGPNTAAPVQVLIEEYVETRDWSYEDFLVSSFDHVELSRINNPEIRIGVLFDRPPPDCMKLTEQLRAYSFNPSLRFINLSLVEEAHQRGLKVFVYTVNSVQDISRLQQMGVDGVFTDFPERVHQVPARNRAPFKISPAADAQDENSRS